MADYQVSGASLTSVADAIRAKGETSESLSFPDGFVSAIGDIYTSERPELINKTVTANGTYRASNDSADGYSSVTVAVPSVHISGTFTGTEEGAITVNVPYTGNGYPIGVLIYPTAGAYNSSSSIYSAVQKYALLMWAMTKSVPSATPAYMASGAEDYGTVIALYKFSDSDATNTTSNRENAGIRVYSSYEAANSWATAVRFNSATTMSVYIAGTSYGFMAGVEYTYQIIYSE